MMTQSEDLKQIHFLQNLPDDLIEKIREISEEAFFEENTLLLRQDQEQHLIYMLVSGKILLNRLYDGGKILTLDEITPGRTFGLSALLGGSVGAFSAICATPCRIITLSARQVLEWLESDPRAGHLFMKQVVISFKARMNHHTRQFLRSLASHPEII